MLNVIALTILAGMMFIPFINVVVGIVAGAALSGVWGCLAGAALAVLITTGELVAVLRDRRPTLPRCSRRVNGFVFAALCELPRLTACGLSPYRFPAFVVGRWFQR